MPVSLQDRPKTFIIPGWIFRSLLRNKISFTDKIDYTSIRKALSIQDLAELHYLNSETKIDGEYITMNEIEDLYSDMTSAQKIEYKASVLSLATADYIGKDAVKRLYDEIDENLTSYKFIPGINFTLIILNEGFFNRIEDFKYKKEFVRSYLKTQYLVAPQAYVNKLPLTKAYLEHL